MSVPRFWREIPYRYRLMGSYCEKCNETFFPPREICPRCRRSGNIKDVKLEEEGEIFSYTIIRTAPPEFDVQTPYAIALIKLKNGPLIMSQLTDCEIDKVDIGKKVRMVFRKISEDGDAGIINYGYKFVLAE
ncbi:transcriptional regulator [Thermococci archaeon]|nr:MAG: transcriptional regulator [Thermococci archaeon]